MKLFLVISIRIRCYMYIFNVELNAIVEKSHFDIVSIEK